jgi:uncharacterized protein (DUF2252 family)
MTLSRRLPLLPENPMDVVRRIQAFNEGRDPERLRLKYVAMRSGAFAFLRGTCHLFYERLPRAGVFKSAPLTWLCGDLHLENFGSYKGDNRLVYFDINDFDEAALGPASWDLVRMLTSLRVGAESLAIRPAEAARLCSLFVNEYASSLAGAKAYWVERDTAKGLVRALLDGLRHRQRSSFLDSFTRVRGKRRRLIVDGKKALPASEAQRTMVTAFMDSFAKTQADPDFYEVLDVARRIAGTGSLGLDRFVILVRGKGSPDGNYLLDLKRAMASALIRRLKVPQPSWRTQAHRVVAAQLRLQAVSAAFLCPVVIGASAYVLRGLQAEEDRVDLRRSGRSSSELDRVIETMARIVAWAQLRSAGREGSAIADELVDFAMRVRWKAKLLAESEACAVQVRHDSAIFDQAYDDGSFET